jgi:hypothetical protein
MKICCNTDNERVIIEANHAVHIKLNSIRAGKSITTVYTTERLINANDDSSNSLTLHRLRIRFIFPSNKILVASLATEQ